MRKIYELWKEVYTGDWFIYEEGKEKKDLIATYDTNSKKIVNKEAERLNEEQRKNDGWRTHYTVKAKLIENNYASNITEIFYYPNIQNALNTLMKKDKDHIFLRHELYKNEVVEKHRHKNYDEWVVFERGKLEVILDTQSQIIDTTDIKEYCSVYFPRNKNHSVIALSNINYYVLRNKTIKE